MSCALVLNRIHEEEIIQPENERERATNQDVLLHPAPAMEIHAIHQHSLHAQGERGGIAALANTTVAKSDAHPAQPLKISELAGGRGGAAPEPGGGLRRAGATGPPRGTQRWLSVTRESAGRECRSLPYILRAMDLTVLFARLCVAASAFRACQMRTMVHRDR